MPQGQKRHVTTTGYGVNGARHWGTDVRQIDGQYASHLFVTERMTFRKQSQEASIFSLLLSIMRYMPQRMSKGKCQVLYNGNVSEKGSIETSGTLTRQQYADEMMLAPADLYYDVLWNKLYRRDIIERYSIRMDENISYSEDTSLACSAETQSRIDEQVVELVRKQHEKALAILKDNRGKLDELASYLYEHETITGEEFMQILNAA